MLFSILIVILQFFLKNITQVQTENQFELFANAQKSQMFESQIYY